MKKYSHLILFIICFGSSIYVSAHVEKSKSQLVVEQLLSKANDYNEKDDIDARDRTIATAIQYALVKANDTLCVKVYATYFEYNVTNPEISKEYAKNLMDIAKAKFNNEWHYYAWVASAKNNATINQDLRQASNDMEKAYHYILLTNNEMEQANCLLDWGYYLESSGRKIEAFNSYQQALIKAERINNDVLRKKSYQTLSNFYVFISNFEGAIEYKQKELVLLSKNKISDSTDYMNAIMELGAIFFYKNSRLQGEEFFNVAFNYAERKKNIKLKKTAIDIYISYLFKNNYLEDITRLYEGPLKSDLDSMESNNPLLYYRLQSCIDEVHGNFESANNNYIKAQRSLKESTYGAAYLTNFYKRYGQFLLRFQKPQAAKLMFDTAFQYAKESNYMPFLAEVANYLDSLNFVNKNYLLAYQFSKISQANKDSIDIQNKADDVLRSEIEYEVLQKNLALEKETKELNRRHNLQYLGLTLGLFTSFILLAAFGAFKVHSMIIRAMGFFTFIFFFEFIVLLADHQIHEYTHGEPWKIMAIKIVLIGILLPFHHWIEHRVVHFLSTHKIIDLSKWKFSFWKKSSTLKASKK